jgi:hypothetical protein
LKSTWLITGPAPEPYPEISGDPDETVQLKVVPEIDEVSTILVLVPLQMLLFGGVLVTDGRGLTFTI